MSDQLRTRESVETSSLPGLKLKSAREEKKLSIDAVASRLMLEPDVIRALEQDDYDRLPEMAYIRGYLLSYARLLGQPESILAQFDELNRAQYPLTVNNIGTRASCSDDGWVRCISVGLVVLFILVVGLWVYENSTYPTGNNQASNNQGDVAQSLAEPKIEKETLLDMPDIVQQETNERSTPVEEEKPLSDVAQEEKATESAVVPEGQDDRASLPSNEQQDIADLLISFTGESWVQVNDLDGNRLQSGIYGSDEQIVMDGERSYSLIIGRADNVEIKFLGEMIDLKAYRNGTIARLTLSLPAE